MTCRIPAGEFPFPSLPMSEGEKQSGREARQKHGGDGGGTGEGDGGGVRRIGVADKRKMPGESRIGQHVGHMPGVPEGFGGDREEERVVGGDAAEGGHGGGSQQASRDHAREGDPEQHDDGERAGADGGDERGPLAAQQKGRPGQVKIDGAVGLFHGIGTAGFRGRAASPPPARPAAPEAPMRPPAAMPVFAAAVLAVPLSGRRGGAPSGAQDRPEKGNGR